MLTTESILEKSEAGKVFKYVLFWGHRPRAAGTIDGSCLSQWYPASFELDGVFYSTAEHYMMAEKARLFDDVGIEGAVMLASHPGEAKKLGRQIAAFDPRVWEQHRFDIVVKGNIAKFEQNEELRRFLIMTGNKILVEASPNDHIWGIGLGTNDPRAKNPREWKGLNLLGFALMAVRNAITGV